MTDKKFTDEEIIRNYEWCIGCTSDRCRECTMDEEGFCEEELQDLVLALINRQKAEIERLGKRISGQKHALFKQQAYTAELQNEIVKLKDYNENLLAANTVLSNEVLESKAKAEAEAYKEFADRIRQVIVLNNTHDGYLVHDIDYNCLMEDIDDVLKELVGEDR